MEWVLYNVANEKGYIKSLHGDVYIRCLGFFVTKHDALNHAKNLNIYLKSKDENVLEIRVVKTKEFRMLLNENYSLPHNLEFIHEKEIKKCNALFEFHKEHLEKQIKDVEYRSQHKIAGDIIFSSEERRNYYKDISNQMLNNNDEIKTPIEENIIVKEENDNKKEGKNELIETIDNNVSKIPYEFQIRCQNFFVLAYIKDYINELYDSNTIDRWKIKLNQEKTSYRNDIFIKLLKQNLDYKPITFHEFMKRQYDIDSTTLHDKMDIYKSNLDEEYFKFLFDDLGKKSDYVFFQQMIDEIEKNYLLTNPIPEKEFVDEPCISFLTVGNNEQEINDWIKVNKHTKFCKEYDVACVSLYEWIRIKNFSNELIKKDYNESFLNTLYESRKNELLEVEKLKENNPDIKIKNVF